MTVVESIKISQNKDHFFAFKLKASKLFAITKINQRIEGKEEGYQRVLSPGRVRSVSRYIQSGGLVPGAIVVSFPKLSFDENNRTITLPSPKDFGWVIDGQHRLAGAYEASKEGTDIELPVVAFVGLNDERQIELFITINREAKNVPSSLYLDLLNYLPKKKTEKEQMEQRIADIARTLNADENSTFFSKDYLYKNGTLGRDIAYQFCTGYSPIVPKDGRHA